MQTVIITHASIQRTQSTLQSNLDNPKMKPDKKSVTKTM